MPDTIGQRIIVTGMAGSGKSTFSRMLAARTGLEVIHIDLHRWRPGWVLAPKSEFLEKQRALLAGETWIVDSNDVGAELILDRADTLIILSMPWWICALRALRRGLRRPAGTRLPEGCKESLSQRLWDEWGIAWRNLRDRRQVREEEASLATTCRDHMKVVVLRTKPDVTGFLSHLQK